MAYIELEDTTSSEKMRFDNSMKRFETTGFYSKMNVYFNANCYRSFWNMRNLQTIPTIFKFDKVTNMAEMFSEDQVLTTNISSFNINNAVNMYRAFYNCYNLIGSPVCGANVTNMREAYANCKNLTGAAACGTKVSDFGYAYWNCTNLTSAYIGPGVTIYTMANEAFHFCNKIQSITINTSNTYMLGQTTTYRPFNNTNLSNVTSITFGPACTLAWRTFQSAIGLTNTVTITVGENVTNMQETFMGCNNMKGSPVCGPNVTDMYRTYCYCMNLTGSPVAGSKVTNFAEAYIDCFRLTGSAIQSDKFVNMTQSYWNCGNITSAYIGSGITIYTMANDAFHFCNKIQSITINTSNTYMLGQTTTYRPFNNTNLSNVTSITFGPACTLAWRTFYSDVSLTNTVTITIGGNVTNMQEAFYGCSGMKGSPVCGPNVTSMYRAYYNCYNLTGSAVCGTKVTNIMEAYCNCYNLTGSPICGANVTNMQSAYYNCINLTGNIICGPLVTDLNSTFFNCTKISTIVIPNATKRITFTYLRNICYRGTYNATRLNIIIENKTTYTDFITYGTTCAGCSFTAAAAHTETIQVNDQNYTTTNYAYNATKNIYLYCLT